MIHQQENGKKTGSMYHLRNDHTTSLLLNGKVLVTGGINDRSGDVNKLCKLYDPLTGNWTKTSGMHFLRYYHIASV